MGKVLLVVDDSTTIRTAVELIFEGSEYRVIAKDSGESGLAWMRTHTPDLILVDERMPDMDGYDFGSKIKSNNKNEEVPILLLACQDGPDESKADNADLDGYVNKPFGAQELVTLVEMLTGSSQISQMPLSFKEQLSQRTREKQARIARGESADLPREPSDDLLSLEAALSDVDKPAKKPESKKDEPVVEIPMVENAVPIEPVRLEARPPTLDLPKPKPEPEKKPESGKKPELEKKPESGKKPISRPEPKPIAAVEVESDDTPVDDYPESISAKIPHRDLVETPVPPRFPPPPSSSTPDLSAPVSLKRESSPIRRPKPDPIFLREAVPPPPRPPPPPPLPALPPMPELKIEMPVEAPDVMEDDRYVDITPEPVLEEPTPPPTPTSPTPIEAPSRRMESEPVNEPSIPVPPAMQRPASSRGILFALLAMAVLLGLVAFYFVST